MIPWIKHHHYRRAPRGCLNALGNTALMATGKLEVPKRGFFYQQRMKSFKHLFSTDDDGKNMLMKRYMRNMSFEAGMYYGDEEGFDDFDD